MARVPVQDRGKRTRARILRAAQSVFSQKGYHGTDSNEIAAAAGVSTGSFYAYFNDKKELFLEALRAYDEEALEKILRGFEDVMESGNGRRLVESLIGRIMAAHTLSPRFHREIIAMTYTDAEVFSVQANEDAKIIGLIEAFLKGRGMGVRVKDPAAAAAVIFRSVEATVHALKSRNASSGDTQVLKELADMICAYVF
jgi:AcrR family transcriptional regulator